MKGGTGLKKEHKRKPYVKPEVKKVPLRPEEAILGFCKTATGTGPLQSTCNFPASCFSPGS